MSVRHVWRGDGERGREGGQEVGGNGEGDCRDGYDGMPWWKYFSRAMPGHPASMK